MIRLRPLFAWFLVAVIVATSGAMAAARGQAAISGQMVLCTGTGPVTVNVDAEGQPVGPAHFCPDCALSLLAAVPLAAPSVFFAPRAVPVRFDRSHRALRRPGLLRPRARAPPVLLHS